MRQVLWRGPLLTKVDARENGDDFAPSYSEVRHALNRPTSNTQPSDVEMLTVRARRNLTPLAEATPRMSRIIAVRR